ncbi:MAG: hypothetical protein U0K87_02565 [Ruminococcus sp.]|nr:hypothetical protein [Ruminococcus sp.]
MATPHNSRHTPRLNISQFAQKSLGKASALPQFFVQPDEKSCYAIRTPEFCGVAIYKRPGTKAGSEPLFCVNEKSIRAAALRR